MATVDHGAGDEAIGRAHNNQSAAQSKIITASKRCRSPLAGVATRHMQPCPLAGCLTVHRNLSRLQRERRGRGTQKGAGVEAHARAGMWQRRRANLGSAGKGGPWSPGKEIEGPLALGARSLAAVLLAVLEVLERRCEELRRAAAASGEARIGGSAGPGGC
ncbi:hypothetical protein HDV64DRAFT_278967 [Trichoderma sp. TUCIM 5745]